MSNKTVDRFLAELDGYTDFIPPQKDTLRGRLESGDYVLLRRRSWERLSERVRVAEARQRYADECRRETQQWVETDVHPDYRRVLDRLTFVYGVARAHGATVEELSGTLDGEVPPEAYADRIVEGEQASPSVQRVRDALAQVTEELGYTPKVYQGSTAPELSQRHQPLTLNRLMAMGPDVQLRDRNGDIWYRDASRPQVWHAYTFNGVPTPQRTWHAASLHREFSPLYIYNPDATEFVKTSAGPEEGTLNTAGVSVGDFVVPLDSASNTSLLIGTPYAVTEVVPGNPGGLRLDSLLNNLYRVDVFRKVSRTLRLGSYVVPRDNPRLRPVEVSNLLGRSQGLDFYRRPTFAEHPPRREELLELVRPIANWPIDNELSLAGSIWTVVRVGASDGVDQVTVELFTRHDTPSLPLGPPRIVSGLERFLRA